MIRHVSDRRHDKTVFPPPQLNTCTPCLPELFLACSSSAAMATLVGTTVMTLTNVRLGSMQSRSRQGLGRLEHEVGFDVCQVLTRSSSGKPYTSPAGHTPKWVEKVAWHRASAFEPDTYAGLVGASSAVVTTLGILLEDAGYKGSVRDGNVLGLAKAMAAGVTGSGPASNPLKTQEERRRSYEAMNRDSGECESGFAGDWRDVQWAWRWAMTWRRRHVCGWLPICGGSPARVCS